MTGFGKAAGVVGKESITVETRSLNSKSLDLSLRMPSAYKTYEIDIRNKVRDELERGKVELAVYKDEALTSDVRINEQMVKSYFQQLESLEQTLGNNIQDKLALIMNMPEVLVTDREVLQEEEYKQLEGIIAEALVALNEFRAKEGAKLISELETNVNNINKLRQQVMGMTDERIQRVKTRLRKNLDQFADDIQVDENRFEQELIFYIEKMDVNEELSRLESHNTYFLECLKSEESEGKKLRFISQEIGREINTLGAKSYDADMQKLVVMMKDELEQIKEQLLNVL